MLFFDPTRSLYSASQVCSACNYNQVMPHQTLYLPTNRAVRRRAQLNEEAALPPTHLICVLHMLAISRYGFEESPRSHRWTANSGADGRLRCIPLLRRLRLECAQHPSLSLENAGDCEYLVVRKQACHVGYLLLYRHDLSKALDFPSAPSMPASSTVRDNQRCY